MKTTLFKTLGAATTLAGIIATAGSANAASIVKTASTAFQETNIINNSVNVGKFDSSLGTLKGIKIEFTGDIKGDAGYENRSPSATPVTIKLGGSLNLSLGNQSLLTLNPENISSYQAAKYDGTTDYAGTSGQTIFGLTASESGTYTSGNSQFLQSFIGTGNTEFLFSALASSVVTGSGNIRSFVDTLAKVSLKVTYDYDSVTSVPEPSAALGFGLIAGIGLLSQCKKSWNKVSN